MESVYNLPNGDRLRVIDTATVGQSLGRILELYRNGATEPVFFGDESRPEGVVISFDQWAEYETLKEEAEAEQLRYDLARQRIANDDPSKWVSFEEMMEEYGLDPDGEGLEPKNRDDKP